MRRVITLSRIKYHVGWLHHVIVIALWLFLNMWILITSMISKEIIYASVHKVQLINWSQFVVAHAVSGYNIGAERRMESNKASHNANDNHHPVDSKSDDSSEEAVYVIALNDDEKDERAEKERDTEDTGKKMIHFCTRDLTREHFVTRILHIIFANWHVHFAINNYISTLLNISAYFSVCFTDIFFLYFMYILISRIMYSRRSKIIKSA